MNRKVENMIDLAYYKSVNICNAFVQKWRDNKPENEELKEFAIAYLDIVFHNNYLEMQRFGYEKSFEDFKNQRDETKTQLDKLWEENKKLIEENKKLKKITGL